MSNNILPPPTVATITPSQVDVKEGAGLTFKSKNNPFNTATLELVLKLLGYRKGTLVRKEEVNDLLNLFSFW